MSQLLDVRFLWAKVFRRNYVRDNDSTARVFVASAALLYRYFMEIGPLIRGDDRSLSGFESWLMNEKIYLVGMVHLGAYDRPNVERTTFVQLLAIVVGCARVVMSTYKLQNYPRGRSIAGFKSWLDNLAEGGATDALLQDMVNEALMYHVVRASQKHSTDNYRLVVAALAAQESEDESQDDEGLEEEASSTGTDESDESDQGGGNKPEAPQPPGPPSGADKLVTWPPSSGAVIQYNYQLSFGRRTGSGFESDTTESMQLAIAVDGQCLTRINLSATEQGELRLLHEKVTSRIR